MYYTNESLTNFVNYLDPNYTYNGMFDTLIVDLATGNANV